MREKNTGREAKGEATRETREGNDARRTSLLLPEELRGRRLRAVRNLDGLLRKGAPSLVFEDIPGWEWTRFREARFLWGGPGNEIEIRRADDLMLTMRTRGRAFPTRAPLIRAVLGVKVADTPERLLALRPGVLFDPGSDAGGALIGEWLKRRGLAKEE